MIMAATRFSFAMLMLWISAVTISAMVDHEPKNMNPEVEKEYLLSHKIGVQGVIYCISGPKLLTLEGAVARMTCEAVDEYGYETAPFSFLSETTDAKGYFIATLSPSELADNRKLKECRAFLDLSPLETCDVPTDINNGISGALLASHHYLNENKMKLYTVGPFFFTPESKGISNGY